MSDIILKDKHGNETQYTSVSSIKVKGTDGQLVTFVEGQEPTGKKLITDTNETNVAAYATAQVSDANLKAENIAKDVSILGITGTHEGGSSDKCKIIYNFVSEFAQGMHITYNGIDYSGSGTLEVNKGDTITIYKSNGQVPFYKNNVVICTGNTYLYTVNEDCNVYNNGPFMHTITLENQTQNTYTPDDKIHAGYTVVVNGGLVSGTYTPPSTQTKSMTLGSAAPISVTPDSDYLLSSVSPNIDTSVIKAENIAKDVTILGVTGTHEGGGGITPTGKILITNTNETNVTNYATAQVSDANLLNYNIKKGVNILGITGTHEGSTAIISISDPTELSNLLLDPSNDGKIYKYTGSQQANYMRNNLYTYSAVDDYIILDKFTLDRQGERSGYEVDVLLFNQ